ncbi:MAG: hypothetical protein HY869_17255 [Chloroflexi bacterium]|nr:hypothetical protein [Chloroflexota bacterium]
MKPHKRTWLFVIFALFVSSCAPAFSLAPAPTLDPLSMQTAIAQTAAAASAQTAAVAQGPQSAAPTPALLEGPTLSPEMFGTAVALTAAAARAGTQALIPDTLTPSVTLPPSQTPSITPTVTNTFVLTLPPRIVSPTGNPTRRGGGGGGNDGGDLTSPYSCKVVGVVPKNKSNLPVNTEFEISWVVKNKGENWPHKSLSITYVEGTLVRMTNPNDLDLPKWEISGGDEVNLPPIHMRTPFEPGVYSTWWRLFVDNVPVCNLTLTVIAR